MGKGKPIVLEKKNNKNLIADEHVWEAVFNGCMQQTFLLLKKGTHKINDQYMNKKKCLVRQSHEISLAIGWALCYSVMTQEIERVTQNPIIELYTCNFVHLRNVHIFPVYQL